MINNKVITFLKEHKEFYPEYFEKNRLSKIKYGYTCDINQIYCYLNKINIKQTDYYLFYQIIKNYFSLENSKILDVACGYIPIMSGIIKDNHNCSVTAINNKILINNYKNCVTKEVDLTNPYDLSPFDLVIGFRPCEITEHTILQCFENKKDFIIYLCPCNIKPLDSTKYNNKKWTYHEWHKYIINLIQNNKSYYSKIIYDHNLEDDCPIIIGIYKD